jgi:putative FmdB family regulatory protein
MPIYAYKCSDCGHEQEVLQKITDAPLTDCPDCGRPSMTKMVTAAGFQLKGSGWYVTDFRNKESGAKGGRNGKTEKNDQTGKTESANDAKAGGTGEAKPDGGSSAAAAAGAHACGSGGCASCS